MPPPRRKRITARFVELGSIEYAILPADTLARVCRKAGVELDQPEPGIDPAAANPLLGLALDDETLAQRLIERRQRVGLSQAALARLAGVRVETLNRIERGHVTPDFATIRKLVVAMKDANLPTASVT